jgi:hypothetical protein
MDVSEEMIQLVVLPVLLLCVTAFAISMRIVRSIERKALAILSAAAANGETSATEMLRALTDATGARASGLSLAQRDRRTGILLLSAAVGLGLLSGCMAFVFDAPVKSPLVAAGVAAFPGAIGLAYLLLSRSARRGE